MKRKLFIVLLVVGVMGWLGAFAADKQTEEPAWLQYEAIKGISCEQLPSVEGKVPKGLEALYSWMQRSNGNADAWLFRMPNGRALLSTSRSEVGINQSAVELTQLWVGIVRNLSEYVQYVDDASECVSVVSFKDRDWMHIRTRVVLDGEPLLSIELECYAINQDGVLYEFWKAWPGSAAYRYDDAAQAQLQADLVSADAWLKSINLI